MLFPQVASELLSLTRGVYRFGDPYPYRRISFLASNNMPFLFLCDWSIFKKDYCTQINPSRKEGIVFIAVVHLVYQTHSDQFKNRWFSSITKGLDCITCIFVIYSVMSSASYLHVKILLLVVFCLFPSSPS